MHCLKQGGPACGSVEGSRIVRSKKELSPYAARRNLQLWKFQVSSAKDGKKVNYSRILLALLHSRLFLGQRSFSVFKKLGVPAADFPLQFQTGSNVGGLNLGFYSCRLPSPEPRHSACWTRTCARPPHTRRGAVIEAPAKMPWWGSGKILGR